MWYVYTCTWTHTHTHINRIVSHWHINWLVWLSNEYYSAIKNEIMPFAATWMDWDYHTKSQKEKDKYHNKITCLILYNRESFLNLLYWSIVNLQCCVNFWCSAECLSHTPTYSLLFLAQITEHSFPYHTVGSLLFIHSEYISVCIC